MEPLVTPARLFRRLTARLRRVSDAEIRCLNRVCSIDGQISREEAQRLIELARASPPHTSIIEIGTWRGRSTVALAFGSLLGPRNRVYAVDPHEDFTGVYGFQFGPADLPHLYRNLWRSGVGHIVSIISLQGTQVAKVWQRRDVSLLWIDGDHRYGAVRADLEAWYPFLVDGAVVAFHDASAEGVSRLLAELSCDDRLTQRGRTGELVWFVFRRGNAQ